MLYHIKFNFDKFDEQRKIKINKKSQKFIVIYNNVLFFCNEIVIVDKKNNIFNIFRIINEIKHLFEIMFVEKNDVKIFCQIYQMNSFQNIIKRRLNLNENLKQKKLLLLTRLMKNVNFYAKTYKICDNRFRDEFNF